MRGETRRAIAMADSLNRNRGPAPSRETGAESWEGSARHAFITLGIIGPGFESVAAEEARKSETLAASAHNEEVAARDWCYSALWRARTGDTATVRPTIARMRRLASRVGPGPGWRVTPIDLCPLLIEAALEWSDPPPARTPALDKVEALLREGPQAEVPGNLARLLVAQWRERQGRYADALALLRGVDPMAWTVAAPAAWLLEGRLAALAGDTAGAIHSWTRYLALRDRPDSGAVAEEVRDVRQRLFALVDDRRR
jgi:hypothetical protein